jgi:hypothetical protein
MELKAPLSLSLRGGAIMRGCHGVGTNQPTHNEAQWGDILHRECGLSSRRAYELMAMAPRAKPLDQLRSKTSARVEKHMEKVAA